MTQPLPWIFEPCENEGPVCDDKGTPWAHAVRGRKPQRAVVVGYGHTEKVADTDARQKAQQSDAREVLGQRGEVVTAIEITPREIAEWFSLPRRYIDGYGTITVMPWSADE